MLQHRHWTQARACIACGLALGVLGLGVPTRRARQVPQDPRELRLRLAAQELQAACEAFRRDHGHAPGRIPGPTLDWPANLDRLRADLLGSKGEQPPYLSHWPAHPFTGSDTVRVLDGKLAAVHDDSPAWLWRPATGELLPDPRARLQP